jgi:NADPH:quinone reductase-like Zn-dependent oxidoreductase
MRAARAVQVSRPGGPLEMVEREILQPGPRQVRVKVQACGLCHSDARSPSGMKIEFDPERFQDWLRNAGVVARLERVQYKRLDQIEPASTTASRWREHRALR